MGLQTSKVTDKLILFFCCTASFLAFPRFGRGVAPVLVSVIFAAILSYIENRKAATALTCLFFLMSAFWPPLVFFLPFIIYNTLFSPLQFFNLLALIPLALFWKDASVSEGITSAVLLLLGLWVCYRTDSLEKMKLERNSLRDSERELSMKLERQNNELLREQDANIHLATLNERNRIAREIHDSVGHLLSSSLLQVGALLAVSKDENTKSALNALKDTLNEAMNSIRSSVHNLFDESIDLYEQLHQLTKDFSFCPVELQYNLDTDPGVNMKYAIVAIVKEALSNIMRHSNATWATVSLHEHPAFYQLIIHDNGIVENYDPEHGIGLRNIRDRVNSFQGITTITTKDGFRIFITLPKKEVSA
jgi:signal transduction histidine kinase